mmetsp:Transcript_18873/g.30973  ORF Transcript_18873/g.30973 Transcript_18873/m.30973 type:complete len:112 (+) Transcript_18873:425-760(+)
MKIIGVQEMRRDLLLSSRQAKIAVIIVRNQRALTAVRRENETACHVVPYMRKTMFFKNVVLISEIKLKIEVQILLIQFLAVIKEKITTSGRQYLPSVIVPCIIRVWTRWIM